MAACRSASGLDVGWVAPLSALAEVETPAAAGHVEPDAAVRDADAVLTAWWLESREIVPSAAYGFDADGALEVSA